MILTVIPITTLCQGSNYDKAMLTVIENYSKDTIIKQYHVNS